MAGVTRSLCHVRWLGGGCSSPVTAVMVSGGGAAVIGAGAMAAASRRGAVRARLLAAARLRRRAAGAVAEGARSRREAHAAWEARGCWPISLRRGGGQLQQLETVVAPCSGLGGVEAAAEAALGLAVVRRRRLGKFRWHGGSYRFGQVRQALQGFVNLAGDRISA